MYCRGFAGWSESFCADPRTSHGSRSILDIFNLNHRFFIGYAAASVVEPSGPHSFLSAILPEAVASVADCR